MRGSKYQFNNHAHTTVSDGELHPKQIEELLARHPSLVISITDHQRIGAYDILGNHPRVVPGIEVKVSEENIDFLIHTETPQELELFYKQVVEPANPYNTMMGAIDMDAETLLAHAKERNHIIVAPHYWAPEGLSALPPERQQQLAMEFKPFVEYNGRMGKYRNAEAKRFARHMRLPLIAGADSHLADQHTQTYTSVRLPEGVPPSASALFAEIRKRKVQFRIQNAGWIDTIRTLWKTAKTMTRTLDGFPEVLQSIRAQNKRADY